MNGANGSGFQTGSAPAPPPGEKPVPRPLLILVSVLTLGVLVSDRLSPYSFPLMAVLALLFVWSAANLALRKRALAVPVLLLFFLGALVGTPPDPANRFRLSTVGPRGTPLCVVGTLTAAPEYQGGECRLTLDTRYQRDETGWKTARGSIRLTIKEPEKEYRRGDRIAALIWPRKPHNFQNPGGFDYARYLAARDIGATAHTGDDRLIATLGGKPPPALIRYMSGLRRELSNLCDRRLDFPENGIMRALLVGEKGGLTPDIRELFYSCGVGHILAISGLHMGFAALGAFALVLCILKRSDRLIYRIDIYKTALLCSVPFLLFYCAISGFSLSTARAAIMVMAFVVSFFFSRTGDNLTAVALAALAVILVNPTAPREASFQLSFAAVFGILYVLSRARRSPFSIDSPPAGRYLEKVRLWLFISVAAYLITAPIAAAHFNRVSLAAIPANLLVTPIVGFWVIPLALCSALLYPLWPALSAWGIQAAAAPFPYLLEVLQWLDSFPFASYFIPGPTWLEIAVYFAALYGLFRFRARKAARIILAAALVAALADVGYWQWERHKGGELRVTFLDVGQGLSILAQFPNSESMMVDGGGFSYSDFDIGEMVVAPCLWREKIMTLDYLVNTHPHPDHLNGLIFLARNFRVKEIWSTGIENPQSRYAELESAARERNIAWRTLADLPRRRDIGGATVEILYPPANMRSTGFKYSDLNNASLVIKITYGAVSFLLTGDVERQAEQSLLRSGQNLRCDVMLCPHHGSATSSTPDFLDAAAPRIAVVSVGYGNWLGLPHQSVLQSYSRRGYAVYRTDRHGAVTVSSDGRSVTVKPTVPEPEADAAGAL